MRNCKRKQEQDYIPDSDGSIDNSRESSKIKKKRPKKTNSETTVTKRNWKAHNSI